MKKLLLTALFLFSGSINAEGNLPNGDYTALNPLDGISTVAININHGNAYVSLCDNDGCDLVYEGKKKPLMSIGRTAVSDNTYIRFDNETIDFTNSKGKLLTGCVNQYDIGQCYSSIKY